MPSPEHSGLLVSCTDQFVMDQPYEQVLDGIRHMGFGAVDIFLVGDRTEFGPLDVAADVAAWASRTRRLVEQRGLAVTDLFYVSNLQFMDLAPNHPDPGERRESRRVFEAMVQAASMLGSQALTTVPGITWAELGHDRSLSLASEEMVWRADHAEAHGVTFCLEPHEGSVTESPDDVTRLIAADDRLDLALDYGHFLSLNVPQEGVDPLLARTHHLHARGAAPGTGQTTLQENTLDYQRILKRLIAGGRCRHICIEYVSLPEDHPAYCDAEAEIPVFREFLLSSLDKIRSSVRTT